MGGHCNLSVTLILLVSLKCTWINRSLNNDIRIDGMKMFRQDQKKCKGGGCAIYCRNNLQVILRKDLSTCELETIWVQI